jgi:putative SOS response-associated peptidase YedK
VCLDENGRRRFRMMRWGLLPSFVKDPKAGPPMINARAEGIASKSAFRGAFAERRCLVPADGFYEWKAEGKAKQPWFFAAANGGPLAFAGIWDRWRPREGEPVESFSIITTGANATMAPIHDRMPAILPEAAWSAWLDPATPLTEIAALLKPAPESTLVRHKVDRRVGNVREDGPALIAALP